MKSNGFARHFDLQQVTAVCEIENKNPTVPPNLTILKTNSNKKFALFKTNERNLNCKKCTSTFTLSGILGSILREYSSHQTFRDEIDYHTPQLTIQVQVFTDIAFQSQIL